MMTRKTLVHVLALTLFATPFALANYPDKKWGADQMSKVDFEEGRTQLTDGEMKSIRDAVSEARKKGEISEIRVVAWADRPEPKEGEKAPRADINLAEDRAQRIRQYIKDDLKVDDVDTYNMAKRPNAIQEFLRTPAAEMKDTMRKKAKNADALVLVYLKK